MTHPVWPFFDLQVVTPQVELRAIDDELGVQLAALAANGIHDPSWMPFGIPWTDFPSPELERNAMQFYWRCRADLSPTSWNINFGVIVDGELVGSTGLFAHHFPTMRSFETGSWLGRAHQGKGIGKEMRQASLHLGFAGFGAQRATTAAFVDNAASLGVTRRLGYEPNGMSVNRRRDEAGEQRHFVLSRDAWAAHRRDDIELVGVDAAREQLGIALVPDGVVH